MRLRAVEVTNILAFESARVELVEPGITLLVGPNNSGKSAFLSAVDRVARPESARSLTRHGASSGRVVAEFALSEEERRGLITRFKSPVVEKWLASEALRTVSWEFEIRGTERCAVAIRVSGGDGSLVPLAIKDNWAATTARVSRLEGWLAKGPSVPLQPTNDHNAQNRNVLEDGRTGDIGPFLEMLGLWSAGVFHFVPIRPGAQATQQVTAVTRDLRPDGSNLAEALNWVQTQEPDLWIDLGRVINELVPEVGRLLVPASGTTLSIEFRDSGDNRTNLKELGTGVEQLLMTAYVGVCRPDSSLIILEEPETGIHPDAQRGLLGYLRQWSADKQILCSTHSTIFLDREVSTARVMTVARREGKSSITVARSDPEILRLLGLSPSDVLSAAGLLIVEGESDAAAVEGWLGPKLRACHVRTVVARGGDLAHRAETLAEWLYAAGALQQVVLFIRDHDELDANAVGRLTKSGAVHVLARRELENYLLDPVAISRYMNSRRQVSGLDPDWTPERVSLDLRSAADRLQSIVVLKRVAFAVGQMRPLDRKQVKALAKRDVTLQEVSAAVSRHVVKLSDLNTVWGATQAAVARGWARRWRDWAPGTELLESVFSAAGIAFDKNRDTAALAGLIPVPQEVDHAVDAFLDRLARR